MRAINSIWKVNIVNKKSHILADDSVSTVPKKYLKAVQLTCLNKYRQRSYAKYALFPVCPTSVLSYWLMQRLCLETLSYSPMSRNTVSEMKLLQILSNKHVYEFVGVCTYTCVCVCVSSVMSHKCMRIPLRRLTWDLLLFLSETLCLRIPASRLLADSWIFVSIMCWDSRRSLWLANIVLQVQEACYNKNRYNF